MERVLDPASELLPENHVLDSGMLGPCTDHYVNVALIESRQHVFDEPPHPLPFDQSAHREKDFFST